MDKKEDTADLGRKGQYHCDRCNKTLSSYDAEEHRDWHFAQDLQAEDEASNSAPTASATQVVPQLQQMSLNSNGPAKGTDKGPPGYAPPAYPPPSNGNYGTGPRRPHSNQVIEAGRVRARDEQEMQNALQSLQFQYRIYNSEIEPEHDVDYWCSCPIHQYQRMKWSRYPVQDMWSKAVMYPGEKAYNDNPQAVFGGLFGSNPYRLRVVSPYGFYQSGWIQQTPRPGSHATWIRQIISLNNQLNAEAQASIDAKEPTINIWNDRPVGVPSQPNTTGTKSQPMPVKLDTKKANGDKKTNGDKKVTDEDDQDADEEEEAVEGPSSLAPQQRPSVTSKRSSFRKMLGIKTGEEKEVKRAVKTAEKAKQLRDMIEAEEAGRWPDAQWRYIVMSYQDKVGMLGKIADLRQRQPIQYLHLLRAGYFEPIPVAWADQASNPLKFSIESSAGWRGITPAWRGYEDTAEERLYWVLNHREGSHVVRRMKPDFISEMNMAMERMARAVPPPPEYYSATDTCHLQHTSDGYSNQVMPAPFVAYDQPEAPTDDTMILLDVSGSMDFDAMRPIYNQYLITGYTRSTQPKNKAVAKAIIRRFSDAMANHDHAFGGYDMVTFANHASYIGTVNHQNLDAMWNKVRIGGGTRVMTGWQKVKELHFQKHSESATHHPVYGWQAGPETPILRLLLLLDGEATDMDEFELDLLGLSWAHVTIFLIGVDGCPHHHRHANELQRISDVNHHVSFVDAQGNTPERFVTHELLKRHLGYEVTMREFEEMEQPPAYAP